MIAPKVVLDTNVLVSALLTPGGNPAQVYGMFLSGSVTLVFCASILEEYQDVLNRPHLRISSDERETVFAAIQQHGELIDPIPSTVTLPDEDDRVFYDTAKTSGAYLITGNTKHYPKDPFVLTPTKFLVH